MRLRHLALCSLVLSAVFLSSCSSHTSVVGNWGVDQPQQPQLTFREDGTLGGTDGCNQMAGAWEDTGTSVEVMELISTKMFCADVDTWLSRVQSLTIHNDTLHVFDAQGHELGTLQRR